jgi:hypothetical protein
MNEGRRNFAALLIHQGRFADARRVLQVLDDNETPAPLPEHLQNEMIAEEIKYAESHKSTIYSTDDHIKELFQGVKQVYSMGLHDIAKQKLKNGLMNHGMKLGDVKRELTQLLPTSLQPYRSGYQYISSDSEPPPEITVEIESRGNLEGDQLYEIELARRRELILEAYRQGKMEMLDNLLSMAADGMLNFLSVALDQNDEVSDDDENTDSESEDSASDSSTVSSDPDDENDDEALYEDLDEEPIDIDTDETAEPGAADSETYVIYDDDILDEDSSSEAQPYDSQDARDTVSSTGPITTTPIQLSTVLASRATSVAVAPATETTTDRSKKCAECKNCFCRKSSPQCGCCVVCRVYFKCDCKNCGFYERGLTPVEKANDDDVMRRLAAEAENFKEHSSTRLERYIYTKGRVEQSISDSTNIYRYKFNYVIGRQGNLVECCHAAFWKFYQTSTGSIERMVREIKTGHFDKPIMKLSQHTYLSDKDVEKLESDACQKWGIFLNEDMRALLRSRSTPAWEATKAWLDLFFAAEAEPQPNRKGERHLHKGGLTKKVIYKKSYLPDMRKIGVRYAVRYPSFCKVWRRCFPQVKIRKYKAVESKCVECALLDCEAEQAVSSKAQQEVAQLFYLHSIKYRGQRDWYHKARQNCCINNDAVSGIADGAAQVHHCVPHYGSAGSTMAKVFDNHLQGIIIHGKCFTLYRSYGNVGKGTNVAIHSWLCEFEKIVEAQGSLPDTIYMQIDGGPENANAYMLGLAELMVHRQLTKRIYLTRLPPGHTHEDIDARFAVIWTHNRLLLILTPEDQKRQIKHAFKALHEGGKVEVEDVFAVPDYKKYFEKYVSIKRAFKPYKEKNYTQLQFIVESCDESSHFPLGVRTFYRAYPTDETVEIVHKCQVRLISFVPRFMV